MLSAAKLVLCGEVLCQGGSAVVFFFFLLFSPFLLEPLEIRDFRVL